MQPSCLTIWLNQINFFAMTWAWANLAQGGAATFHAPEQLDGANFCADTRKFLLAFVSLWLSSRIYRLLNWELLCSKDLDCSVHPTHSIIAVTRTIVSLQGGTFWTSIEERCRTIGWLLACSSGVHHLWSFIELDPSYRGDGPKSLQHVGLPCASAPHSQ